MGNQVEQWKDIPGFEGRYQISSLGRVKSLPRKVNNHTGELMVKEKILKQRHDFKGYLRIDLKDNNGKHKYLGVHRLVAETFISNPEGKPQVNHIDGIKDHNEVSNLEWVTNGENARHAYKIGLNHVTGKAGRPKRKVVQKDIETGEVIQKYSSISEAAKAVGCKSPSNIGQCCRNMRGRKSTYGYKWEYERG